jgi:pimeloyl-ACP methyl ester carboxylesterase
MASVVSQDGTKIAYDRQGRGAVLILVLGALNKRGSGKKLDRALSDDFTVISYDRRGRGDSGDTEPYVIEKEIDDIEALIDELGGSALLYGHSSGGVLALLATQKLGKKVAGLAVYEIPYNGDPAAQAASEEYRKTIRRLLAEDRRADAVALFVKSVGVTDKQVEAMKRLPLWNSLTAMAPTLEYDTVELMERYPTIDPKSVQTPTLVMYGSASPDFMAVTATELSGAIPNATLRPLEGQTHDVKPDVLAPALVTALK